MARVKEVAPKVMRILKDYPETRNDDRMLILTVYRKYYGVMRMSPFGSVILDKTLPSFETIRRSRQKIQQENPELRAADKVEEIRSAEQIEYREFAREKGV